MKPIIQKLWMFIAVLCASLSASAYVFYSDGLYYNILSEEDHTVEVTDPCKADYVSGDIEIPRKVIYNSKTYTVTSIGDDAFSYCSSLESVTIPNSVTSIGDWAFHYCSSLESVTIPNSVTSIGDDAFYDCNDLKTIYMQCEVPIECNPSFSDKILKETALYVPTGTKTYYKIVDPWRNFWNIEEMDFSGVDGIEADEYGAPHISVNNGILTIGRIRSDENVSVYDMQGRIFYSGTSHTIDNLSPGLYIVKTGSRTIKISI